MHILVLNGAYSYVNREFFKEATTWKVVGPFILNKSLFTINL